MIPAVSPPTDNLYKLIAIFGLGLMVLGVLNFSHQQKRLIEAKIEIKELENHIFDTVQYYDDKNAALQAELLENVMRIDDVEALDKKLDKILLLISKDREVPFSVKMYLATKIDIIEIKTASIHRQEVLDRSLMGLSLFLMLFGFSLWYLKDQRWKDQERCAVKA